MNRADAVGQIAQTLQAIAASLPELVAGVGKVMKVEKGAISALFEAHSDILAGRARTLFTKEPITVAWIEGMAAGDVLYDVGANVGMYSVWAAKHSVKVYAFEPMAENYAQLTRNLAINGITDPAYCLAITARQSVDRLHLSTEEVGHSCHSYGEAVGPNLQPRTGPTQGCVGMSIDELVKAGLPVPNHIKIDVDGFEWRVIKGAAQTLKRPEVKTVLVELSPSLVSHQGVLDYFATHGWYCDPVQVKRATRKAGEWKGYAEHLFHRLSPVAHYTLERIRQAEVRTEPFPHIYVEQVFEPALYEHILTQMPTEYVPIEQARGVSGYPDRFVASPRTTFWRDFERFLRCGAIRTALCAKFGVAGDDDEMLLIRDKPGYSIGPHTDSVKKALSALFYLPKDDALAQHGTSLYTPKATGFTCAGHKHHHFEDFDCVATMPFKPNSLFAFPKSDRSFHGVEAFTGAGVRDVLLYDVRA